MVGCAGRGGGGVDAGSGCAGADGGGRCDFSGVPGLGVLAGAAFGHCNEGGVGPGEVVGGKGDAGVAVELLG